MTLKIIGPICAYNHTKLQLSISNSYHATADNVRFIVKMWPQGNGMSGLEFLWIKVEKVKYAFCRTYIGLPSDKVTEPCYRPLLRISKQNHLTEIAFW